jgi:hypothetical protein
MNIAMTTTQDILANQAEKPSQEQQDIIRTHTIKGAMMLANLGVADETWLDIVSNHHDDTIDKANLKLLTPATRLTRVLKMVDRYAAMISPRLSRFGRSATESARAVMANSAKTDAIARAMVRAVGLCPPGTYVRLDNEELAVVLRRSSQPNHPYVAIVGKANGELWPAPRLHATAQGQPHIRAALPANAMRARLNHFHILQLSAYAAKQAPAV